MTLDRPCSMESSLVTAKASTVSVYLIPSVPVAHKFTCQPAVIWVVDEAGNPSLRFLRSGHLPGVLPRAQWLKEPGPLPQPEEAQVPLRTISLLLYTKSSQGVKLLKTKPKREVFCRQLLLSDFHKPPLMKVNAWGRGRRKYGGKYYISTTKLPYDQAVSEKTNVKTWNMWAAHRCCCRMDIVPFAKPILHLFMLDANFWSSGKMAERMNVNYSNHPWLFQPYTPFHAYAISVLSVVKQGILRTLNLALNPNPTNHISLSHHMFIWKVIQ